MARWIKECQRARRTPESGRPLPQKWRDARGNDAGLNKENRRCLLSKARAVPSQKSSCTQFVIYENVSPEGPTAPAGNNALFIRLFIRFRWFESSRPPMPFASRRNHLYPTGHPTPCFPTCSPQGVSCGETPPVHMRCQVVGVKKQERGMA